MKNKEKMKLSDLAKVQGIKVLDKHMLKHTQGRGPFADCMEDCMNNIPFFPPFKPIFCLSKCSPLLV